jgi:hypothetical protein
MTNYADFEQLLAADDPAAGAEDFTLPSGKVIRVRGLTRHELMFNGKGTEDSAVIEIRNVKTCVVEPKLTIEQVTQWQRKSKAGGDFRALSEKIRDLSGLGEGADKSDPGDDRGD